MIAPGLVGLRQRWPLLEVEILVEHRSLSLARREAEIAIRWARPTKGELFATRLGPVPYRLYRNPRAVDQAAVAGLDASLVDLPESRWLSRQAGLHPVIRSNSMLPLVAAARAGACAILLPEFVGRRIRNWSPRTESRRSRANSGCCCIATCARRHGCAPQRISSPKRSGRC